MIVLDKASFAFSTTGPAVCGQGEQKGDIGCTYREAISGPTVLSALVNGKAVNVVVVDYDELAGGRSRQMEATF